ncbi:putative fatty acyl-CoA reductase CG8303 [Phlebotomus papatasi]|uniref:putative fatty acyl-CoA reductase CG8303 n=1 Tax=Phlebotomus papatasi TaxID=29031 RepID=UPI002483B2E2|nr:putative fatty acyl-CoA reductase CG8303 [Phlebotomus papatasi]
MGLIEGLLSSSPDLCKIYVVVREKKGQSPSERVVKLLSSEIFNHLSAETKAKVVPIVGNLTAQDLGLDPITLKEIRETVTVVYHNAGLIKFNRSLKEAVLMNVLSTLRCIDLAKSLVYLSAFIYTSTAWANSNIQDKILEVIYRTKESPREMIKLALETPSTIDRVAESQDDFIEGHQNTYSYSKQLAENLILEEMAGLPTGIVRPSLVYGFYHHEIPGWMGSSQSGHCGVIRLFIKGVGRNLFGNPKSTVFAVPCDHVVNCMLALTVSVGSRIVPSKKPEICHVSNNKDINPITIQDMANILNEESWKNPCDSPVLQYQGGRTYEAALLASQTWGERGRVELVQPLAW